jgi:hypothetical protein
MDQRSQSKLVFFACAKCGTPYWAREEPRSHRYSGRIDCEDCQASALEWADRHQAEAGATGLMRGARIGAEFAGGDVPGRSYTHFANCA